MAAETELERMVVRLLGEGQEYTKMLKEAEAATRRATDAVAKQTKVMESKVTQSLKRVGAKFKTMGQSMKSLGMKMSLGMTLPLAGAGAVALKSFANFDQAMTESTSIMKVNEEQSKKMESLALGLSKESIQSPKELAESYYFLASAGKDAEQSMALLPQVTKFATAGAFDMATATDLLTDAQSALGMSSKDAAEDAANMAKLGDVLVGANTLANASVQQFSQALTTQAGAAFKAYNKELEEGVALLAAYADQGIKSNEAGTMTSRVMLLLSKSAQSNAAAHKKLGFSVYDANGKMRHMADIVKNLEDITAGMSDETKAATLTQLGFQARVQQAILPLLGTSEAMRGYYNDLKGMQGITDRVAGKQLKSFSNQMKILKNQLTVVAIEIGKTLAPYVGKLANGLKKLIKIWDGLSPAVKKTIVLVGVVVAAIGPALMGLGLFMALAGAAFTGLATLLGTIGPLIAFMINPITLLVGLTTAFFAGVLHYTGLASKALKWFSDQWKKLVDYLRPAIDGIKAAIEANDIGLAFKIAWAQIRLSFQEGIRPLKEAWIGFTMWFKELWYQTIGKVKEYWIKTTGTLSKVIIYMMQKSGMLTQSEANDAYNILEKKEKDHLNKIAEQRKKALDALGKETAGKMKAVQDEIDRLEAIRDERSLDAAEKAAKAKAKAYEEAAKAGGKAPPGAKPLEVPIKIGEVKALERGSAEAVARILEYEAGKGLAKATSKAKKSAEKTLTPRRIPIPSMTPYTKDLSLPLPSLRKLGKTTEPVRRVSRSFVPRMDPWKKDLSRPLPELGAIGTGKKAAESTIKGDKKQTQHLAKIETSLTTLVEIEQEKQRKGSPKIVAAGFK